MKLVPIVIFSFFSCSSLAQNCTIIDGLAVNCLDQHNRKQGYWKEIQKELISTVHSGYGSVDGCQRKDVFNFYLLADGNFLNDKKTGVWNYYVLWTKLEDKFKIVEKEIHYLPTGEIRMKHNLNQYQIVISSDSTKLEGFAIANGDSVTINCGSSRCHFTLGNGKEILQFDYKEFNDFAFELERLLLGEYDRRWKLHN